MKECGMFSNRLNLFTSSVDISFIRINFGPWNVLRTNNEQRRKDAVLQFFTMHLLVRTKKSM